MVRAVTQQSFICAHRNGSTSILAGATGVSQINCVCCSILSVEVFQGSEAMQPQTMAFNSMQRRVITQRCSLGTWLRARVPSLFQRMELPSETTQRILPSSL